MSNDLRENRYGVFTAILPCALWGMAFPAIKLGYRVYGIAAEDAGGQLVFAGLRFFLAGVLAWVIGSVMYKRPLIPKRSSVPKIAILAVFQTFLQYIFFYIGLAHTTGVKSSIITASNVFFACIASAAVFRQETMSVKKWLGVLVGFAGVVVINMTGGLNPSFGLTGEGFMVISAVSSAISSVLIKKFTEDEPAFTLSAFQFMLGGAALFVAGAVIRGKIFSVSPGNLWQAVLILLWLAGISAVAYSLWGVLLHRYEVSGVTVFGFLIPVFGTLFSVLLLDESAGFSPVRVIISLALVSAGTLLVQR